MGLSVDDAAWQAATDEWLVLADRAGHAASMDGGEEVAFYTRMKLSEFGHAPHTKTPSPRGGPPANISGALIASIDVREDGAFVLVGPTASAASSNGPYGRFLELGGEHIAHNASGYMHWEEDGRWHRAAALSKAPRPFLRPATEEVIDSGKLTEIYTYHWGLAQEEVTS